MRKLLTILFLLVATISFSQVPNTHVAYLYGDSATYMGNRDTLGYHPTRAGAVVTHYNALWWWDGTRWVAVGSGSGGGSDTLAGGAFTTSNVQVGFNPGTNITSSQLLTKVFYGLKPPTATLTGGTQLEYTSASTVSQTLNWSAGRQSNTATLSSIVVAGISQSFSQPLQNASVSGTQAVSVPANTTTAYNNVVTATDGQTATATTTYTFAPRRFYGFISDTTGIRTGSQDATIRALTSNLSTTRDLSTNTGNPSEEGQFYVYAYIATLNQVNSITFNGIPALDAMTIITKTFTTANGYTGTYYIIYNKQAQTTSSDVIFQ